MVNGFGYSKQLKLHSECMLHITYNVYKIVYNLEMVSAPQNYINVN